MNLSADEINLHNDWADSENIDNINERTFFESIMAVENKFIVGIINSNGGFENKKILDVGCWSGGRVKVLFGKCQPYGLDIDSNKLNLDPEIIKKRLKNIGINFSDYLSDLEDVKEINDSELKEKMHDIVINYYSEFYGDRKKLKFNKIIMNRIHRSIIHLVL